MIGIEEKHKQFQWKDSTNRPPIGPNQSPTSPILTERNVTEPNRTTPSHSAQGGSKPKKTNPEIRVFIDWYYQKHLGLLGKVLHVDGGVDGSRVKAMLGTLGLDELKRRADLHLLSQEPFAADKGIRHLSTCINRYAAEKKDTRGGTDYDKYK
jgi:hypothetical protein